MTLTKGRVLDKLPPEEVRLAEFLQSLDDVQFRVYLGMLVDSISPHEDGNTHLNFDYDRFPEKDLWFSCSSNLHHMLLECRARNDFGPCGDYVVELDKEKVKALASKWIGKRMKIRLAKWIGYLLPNVGRRILYDCILELGLSNGYVDVHDLEFYCKQLESTRDAIDKSCKNDQLWMISSY